MRANEAKGSVARGIDPTTEKAKRDSIPTLAEFSLQFLQWSRQHKRSWRDDESRFKVELLPRFGNRVLDAISPRDILLLHAEVQARSSNSNANRYLALMKRMYTLATEWEILEYNPARVIKKVQENLPRERVLTSKEIPRFLRALDALENRSIAAGLRLLLYTGLRKSEVFLLEWRHVNREKGTLYLAQTKSGKPRLVFLNSLAWQVIEARWEQKGAADRYVFPGRRPGKHVVEVRVSFKLACAMAEITGVCVHTLRHTFASICVSSGVPLYDVQKLLGHASSQTTQRYAHLEDACQRQATETFATKIAGLFTESVDGSGAQAASA